MKIKKTMFYDMLKPVLSIVVSASENRICIMYWLVIL